MHAARISDVCVRAVKTVRLLCADDDARELVDPHTTGRDAGTIHIMIDIWQKLGVHARFFKTKGKSFVTLIKHMKQPRYLSVHVAVHSLLQRNM